MTDKQIKECKNLVFHTRVACMLCITDIHRVPVYLITRIKS